MAEEPTPVPSGPTPPAPTQEPAPQPLTREELQKEMPNIFTKDELQRLLVSLDHSLDEYLKVRNGIARMVGQEPRAGLAPVSPVAPEEPPERVCPESSIERGNLIREAILEEIKHGHVLLTSKTILDRYQPRWGWIPSEATINGQIERVLRERGLKTIPVGQSVPAGAPPPQTSMAQALPVPPPKLKTPHEAIMMVLTQVEVMAYKPLSERIMALGFSLEDFSTAYVEMTADGRVVEENLDHIRLRK